MANKDTEPKPKGFKVPSMEELLDAGVHFGHQVRRWNPEMEKYIYTHKKGIHIIDLEQTEELLTQACNKAFSVAAAGEKVVFVGTKRQAKDIVKMEADRSGALYVNERWLGGTITNFPVIKKNITKLLDLKSKREKGEFGSYTKKERLLIDRDIEKLEKYVGGMTTLEGKPGLLFVIDARREKTAVREALRSNVPVVALIDTNSNPNDIDYVIPGNDDAIRSIAIIVKAIADAVEAGYSEYAKLAEKKEAELKKAQEKAKAQAEKAEQAEKEEKEEKEDLSDVEVDNLTVSAAQASYVTKESGETYVDGEEDENLEIVEGAGEEEEKEEITEKSDKKSKK